MRNLLLSIGLSLFPLTLVAQDGSTNEPPVVPVDCRESINANGQIVTGEGKKDVAQFKVRSEEAKNGNISGRLDYNDKTTGLAITSRELVGQEQVDPQTRRLTYLLGNDDTNAATAVVTVRDLGKGKDDFFEVSVGDYLASGNLKKGNVVLKRKGKGCSDL